MAHKNLNDRTVKALKPAPKGTTQDYWDKGFAGFGVRVSDKGRKTFVLAARYPGGNGSPTRRKLGVYGPVTLADARDKARAWLKQIEKGVDPQAEEDRKRLEEQATRKNTFAFVAEDFIAEKLGKKVSKKGDGAEVVSYTERAGRDAERDLRNVFVAEWGDRPITSITDLDVVGVIKAKTKDGPVYARNLLALLKRFFNWAIDQRVYKIQASPCERLKPKSLFGERIPRQHKLSDAELFALWRVADRTPYPYGQVYKLLLLSGLRLNEVAQAQRSEFDTRKKRWIIPAARMKAKNSRARDHAVPLVPAILEVLDSLPEFDGDFVFSNNGGKRPAWIGDKIKKDLDARMLRTLRALARRDGENPRKVKLGAWTNHDLRRNVRSGMSTLRISDTVAEAVLAHTQGIISKTYNVDDLFDQKAEALAAWAGHLKKIITPPPANVVPLAKARA